MTATTFRYDGVTGLANTMLYGAQWDNERNEYVVNDTLKNEGITSSWHGVSFSDDVTREEVIAFAQKLWDEAADRENYARRTFRRLQSAVEGFRTVGAVAKAAAHAQEWCDEYEQYVARMVNMINDAEFSQVLREAAERRNEYTVTVTILARNEYSAQDYAYRLQNNTEEYGCRVVGNDPSVERVVKAEENDEEIVLDEASF